MFIMSNDTIVKYKSTRPNIFLCRLTHMVKANDLFNEQKIREKHKTKTYKKIYIRIENKILQSSTMNLYQCWYLIPEFLFNIPLYNMDECKKYLENKLLADGFDVSFSGNIIIISWGR